MTLVPLPPLLRTLPPEAPQPDRRALLTDRILPAFPLPPKMESGDVPLAPVRLALGPPRPPPFRGPSGFVPAPLRAPTRFSYTFPEN